VQPLLQEYWHARSVGLGSAACLCATCIPCNIVVRVGGKGDFLFVLVGTFAGTEVLPLNKWIVWIPAHSNGCMGLPLHDAEKLEELSLGFSEHSGGIFDGCLLAIDGFAVLTRQPYDHEVRYKKDY
jgi:hypothetical protein